LRPAKKLERSLRPQAVRYNSGGCRANTAAALEVSGTPRINHSVDAEETQLDHSFYNCVVEPDPL
jgi:hypothetical protein